MKFHVILLASLMMPIGAFAAEAADTQLFPFKLGTDQFGPEVTEWFTNIMGNLKTAAQKDDSDWAKWTIARTEVPLADVYKNPRILSSAKKIYTKVQQDELVIQAFTAAKEATQKQAALEDRKAKWLNFRKIAATQLSVLRKAALPSVQDPTPGSARALDEFIERNREVQLDSNGKEFYDACNLVLFAFRQNHRLVDSETDGASLVLHKNVTEKPKAS